jgi:AcrR family transcriptional regulator
MQYTYTPVRMHPGERLLDAAEHLFAQRSVSAISPQDIAKATGVAATDADIDLLPAGLR